jgi:murein L,D-transpeptidase YcbB/YkuD
MVLNGVFTSGDTDIAEDEDEMNLPVLRKGDNSFDVLSLRALLFQRFLAAHFTNDQMIDDRHIETPMRLRDWLRREEFDEALENDVKLYQQSRKLDADGIVGKNTWNELLRIKK